MKVLKQSTLTCHNSGDHSFNQFGDFTRVPRWMIKAIEDSKPNKIYGHFTELSEDIELKVELDKLDLKSLNFTVENNYIEISGSQNKNTQNKKFNLKYKLPVDCDTKSLSGRYYEGVLYLYLNKNKTQPQTRPEQMNLNNILSFFSLSKPKGNRGPKAS